jgi:L-2-hydroxyglutarate oxidase
VRAQAILPDGRLVDDFHFVNGERILHAGNAPSPAVTASLAIGERIVAEMAGMGDCQGFREYAGGGKGSHRKFIHER